LAQAKSGKRSSRPKRIDAQRNYEHLLKIAGILVKEEGTDASLREIARRADVGLGTLYRHFPTRDVLLEAILRNSFEELAQKAEALEHSDAPLDALTSWLEEFADGSATYRGLTSMMMATIKDPKSALYTSCFSMRVAAGRLLKRAQEAGRIRDEVTANDLFTLVTAIAWAADYSASEARSRSRLLSLLINGLESRPQIISSRVEGKKPRSKDPKK